MFPHLALCLLAVATPLAAQVRWILPFRENAAHGDRSRDNRIVFERNGALYLTRPELFQDRCLTCHFPQLVHSDCSDPVWHPAGRFLAFATNQGIWFLHPDTLKLRHVFMTPVTARSLRFSRDGSRLAWFSRSQVMLANVTGETLSDPRPVTLPELVEDLDDFTADGTGLLVTAQHAINACPLMQTAIQTTCSPLAIEHGQRLEHARLSPSGRHLLVASTGGVWLSPNLTNEKNDYWLMDLASLHTQRMTWFNEVQNPHYVENGARVTYASWTPDGLWILATLVEETGPRFRSKLVMIQFPEPE